ncbi:MAG: 2-dehydropantoate 2-reductase, partial [Kiloniellales bacterium]|nr:2-dehydropantoate 2-reductase [Kiloniellales bacterium]
MKICIFGAGAIGGYLAAGLAQARGVDLSLIVRGAHLAAIKAEGLNLIKDGERSTHRIAATDDPRELGPQDVVISGLKAHQSWDSAESLLPLLGTDTAVVTCQNGVPWWYFYNLQGPYKDRRLDAVDRGNRQWDVIGPDRAIGCSVYPAAEITEPGVIKHVYGNKFALGEPSGTTEGRVVAISEV